MIAFTCKPTDKIVLPTLGVAVEVVKSGRKAVRLRIDAPPQLNPFAMAARETAREKQTEML